MFHTNRTQPRSKGAALVEYVVLMGLLAVVLIFVVLQLGALITTTFDDSNTTVVTEIETATGITIGGGTTPPGGTPMNEPQPGEILVGDSFGTVYRSDGGNFFNLANDLVGFNGYAIDASYFSGMTWSYTFLGGDIGTLTGAQFNSNGTYGALGWDNGESCATVPYPNTDTVHQRATSTGPNGETWRIDVFVSMNDYIC